jgi:hypothetical protein
MEVEDVFASCRSLEQTTRSFNNEANELQRAIRRLDAAWDGGNSNRFVREASELVRKLEKQVELLNVLSGRGYHEGEQWEQVDLYYSKLGLNFSSQPTVPTAIAPETLLKQPTNMQELANLTMDGPDSIRRINIGNNEYLVVIGGTKFKDPHANNNLGAAVQSWLGIPTDFQLRVAAALPAGALIHFAGYSQGGIVAQNLAKDPKFKDQVVSVTTFGSNVVSGVPKKNLTMYAANGDIVPLLERDKIIAAALAVYMPASTWPFWLPKLLETDVKTHIAGTPGNFVDDHGVYRNSPELKDDSLPFTIRNWNGSSQVINPGSPDSGLSAVYKNIMDSIDSGQKKVSNFFDDNDWI